METVDSSVVETATKVLEAAVAVLSECSEPFDVDAHVSSVGHFQRAGAKGCEVEHAGSGSASALEVPVFGVQFLAAAGELVGKARVREGDSASAGYVAPVGLNVVPVYSKVDGDAECFILATVGELAGSRLYPLVVPYDVIDFSVSLFSSKADGIRFLSELARVYCDAVRLSGNAVGFGRKLLASLRNLVGVLGVALGDDAHAQGCDSS